ncbi:hypothetical protein SO694_00085163 [Aureococcus anophagefferens]|uniref:Uncharacterized protein n=1 Tax=Aureococcus anophagefferens TaxID=44056 RepID=A0ABR1G3N0_AURAN
MNEWRGALGAYVQKLGEYDCLSDDDEKEPALRAELLSTVLKSGTVSSRGAWGDKDCGAGVAAVCKALRDEDQLETIEEASDEESDEGSRRAADVEKSPDDGAGGAQRRRSPALGRLRARRSRRPEALEDIYAEASASGVGVDDLAALLDALDDAVDRDDLDAIEACVDAMPSSPGGPRAPRAGARAAARARDEAADLEDARRAALDAERDAARVAAVADAGLAAAQRVGSPAALRRAVEALGRDASPDKTRLAAHVLCTRTRVADALAAASAPGELRAYTAAARGAAVGRARERRALYVTRSSLGLDPDDRDDERRHVALVAGSFDGATGAYRRRAPLCSRDGRRGGDGPGDGGEYLLDGAALDVYAREDRCCFDYDDLDAEASEARQRLLRAARCGGPGDAAAAPGFHARVRARARRQAKPGSGAPRPVAGAGDAADAETLDALRSEAAVLGLGGTAADALSARLDVEALLDADAAGADDLGGLVLAIDRARFGGLRAVSLKRRTVDRAEARGVARDLFATRGAEVRA